MLPSHQHVETCQLLRPPFFQRYGVSLPSSLTEGHSLTLGVVPQPTCVGLRYGRRPISLEAFLGGLGGSDFRPLAGTRAARQACCKGDLPPSRPSRPQPGLSIRQVHLPYRVPPSLNRCSPVQDPLPCFPSPTT